MTNIKILVHIGLLYFVKNEIVYFDIFGVEHTPEEINSVMCSYFCIGFIDFMLAGKTLIDYTNLFSPYDLNKKDSIILSYFKDA